MSSTLSDARAPILYGVWFKEAATDSERIIFVRESMDRKVINSEGLLMIISFWPSQITSLSITQPAARLHSEHWMNFMVDLGEWEGDAILGVPRCCYEP